VRSVEVDGGGGFLIFFCLFGRVFFPPHLIDRCLFFLFLLVSQRFFFTSGPRSTTRSRPCSSLEISAIVN